VIDRRQRRRRDGKTYTVYRVRWWDDGRQRSKTFDRAADAHAFEAKVRTLKRTESLAELDAGKETLAEFTQEWWRTYAANNLERATLQVYARLWNLHAEPRLGDRRLRDITPRVVAQFRADLESAGVGAEAIRKTMAMLQGILQRAVEWERLRSNPVRAVRKPPKRRQRAIVPFPPATIEQLRKVLLDDGRLRDATLISVLAYAGLRPQEALALTWGHVRERTLLIEQAVADGELKGQKTGKPPRTVTLLGPLKQDLAEWRLHQGRPTASAYVFPAGDGNPWREHDWRNWRRRVYAEAARACGIQSSRPYDLRHSFASLLIHERRLSIVEIAHQLGHNPNVCLSTYAHVMAELDHDRGTSAEDQIREAREALRRCGPNVAHEADRAELEIGRTPDFQQALCRTRTDDPFLTMEVLYQLS
jgi:integrase